MVNPYRELFAAPGATHFALAGLLARIALPMTGIGIITMLSQLRTSYALAGAVSATFVLTYALLSPQISRLVDRHGQSRMLPAATMISAIGMLVLLAASRWSAPDWILFAGALLSGFMPSISAMLRARWTAIYRGKPQLSAAYSLETVLDEATYIIGPALSVGLSVTAFPQAGPLAALVLLVLGIGALTLQHGTEPQVQLRSDTDGAGSVIRLANVRLLALLMVAMGIVVGTVDIVSVALSEQLGQPAAASLVLAAYAVGSFLAGLLFGAMKLTTPLHRLLLLGGLATAITTLPLMLADSIFALATTVLVAGLFFAPTMIVAMTLVERLVPEHQLTEGMTWLLAGLNVGVAFGAVASGQVVDAADALAGFAVALGAGFFVLLLSLLGYLRLRASGLCLSASEVA
ncbi:major facilitator superfamily protein [Advenella kashmirensis WT001]|uniref:Major facilitator superfamily protein n=1 Tax=Advenella kashmirensis (strain DSM 17095 / LMG 22695 / WT001) TaxID=1036672 RepID=I3U9J5_ADVKW|nr:MFS transporter [Advenella kashmirensis]AFK61683.1 major facilitator superfamily protein [Advenella kashmirensis WT001]